MVVIDIPERVAACPEPTHAGTASPTEKVLTYADR